MLALQLPSHRSPRSGRGSWIVDVSTDGAPGESGWIPRTDISFRYDSINRDRLERDGSTEARRAGGWPTESPASAGVRSDRRSSVLVGLAGSTGATGASATAFSASRHRSGTRRGHHEPRRRAVRMRRAAGVRVRATRDGGRRLRMGNVSRAPGQFGVGSNSERWLVPAPEPLRNRRYHSEHRRPSQ